MRLPQRRRPAGARGVPAGRPQNPKKARLQSRLQGRPQLSRRPAPEPDVAEATPPRRTGRLTGRAAVLGLALCAVLLTLAYPMRQYLTQREQISVLEQHQAAQRRQVAALQQRQQEWNDPAYIKAQARKRLQYVMPGEIGYVVLDGRLPGTKHSARPVTVAPGKPTQHSAWYAQLWGTVQRADTAP